MYKKTAEKLNKTYDEQNQVEKMLASFQLYDEISEILQNSPKYRKVLDDKLDDNRYQDDEFHIMTTDITLWIRPLYENRKNKSLKQ